MTELVIPDQPGGSEVDSAEMLDRARAWLAELTTEDLGVLADTSKRVAALASVAQRVGVAAEIELDYAQAARESERRLGQLLTEGREDGTVATKGGINVDVTTLPELGVSRDLAADAAAFARLSDEQWQRIIDAGRDTGVLARSGVRRGVTGLLEELRQIEDRERDAHERMTRLERQRLELLDEIKQAAAQPLSRLMIEADLTIEPDAKSGDAVLGPKRSSVEDLENLRDYIISLSGVRRRLEAVAASMPDMQTEADAGFHAACKSALSAIVVLAHGIGAQINEREHQPKMRRVQ